MQPASAAMAIGEGREVADSRPDCAATAGTGVRFSQIGERLDALRGEWQSLTAEASEPNPFSESWFVAASAQHLAPPGIRLAEVRRSGTLIGILPLVIEDRYGRTPVRFVQNWRHHHLFLGTPLVRSGHEAEYWRALLLALDEESWVPGFLHLRDLVEGGPVHNGLIAVAADLGRPAPTVYRETRAFLESSLTAEEYFSQAVRKKKRKELARLQNRLSELGQVTTRSFSANDDLAAWCDDFLRLEFAGWKGREGSALACDPATESFFRQAAAGAAEAGRLQILRMDLDGRPIGMLVNFLTPPGSFSFKTAFDEDYARFSPGVLIQLDNLKILERPDIAWMDSCAVEQHPMIEQLWAERRTLVRVTIPLSGARRRTAFAAARLLEQASAARRRLFSGKQAQP